MTPWRMPVWRISGRPRTLLRVGRSLRLLLADEWRARWEQRIADCEAGRDSWPSFLKQPEGAQFHHTRLARALDQPPLAEVHG